MTKHTKPTGEEQLKELFYRAGLPHPNQDETSAQLLTEIVRWHNDLILQEKKALLEEVRGDITHGYITVEQIVETIDDYLSHVKKELEEEL